MADTNTGTVETGGNLLFYKQPEPLNSEAHGKLGVTADTKHPFAFIKDTQLIPLTVAEFTAAALCYPIIFAGTDRIPVAVMGMQKDHNAFVDADGMMPEGVYLPGFVRRYPFVSATTNGDEQNLMVCIDRAAPFIAENAEQPFFVDGKPSEFTNRAIEFIQLYEGEAQGTRNFVTMMNELDLLASQDMNLPQTGEDGKTVTQRKIGEFVGISAEKFNKLPAEKLVELRDNGGLQAIYAQLMSQANWQRVIALDMKNGPAPTDTIGETSGKA